MFFVIFVICLKIILENWVMFFLEIENSLMINILIIFVLKFGLCIKIYEIEKYIINVILYGFGVISKKKIMK